MFISISIHVLLFSYAIAFIWKQKIQYMKLVLEKQEKEIEYKKAANFLIQNNKKVKYLFIKLKNTPTNGSKIRKLERSQLIRNILMITNYNVGLEICRLADGQSKIKDKPNVWHL